MTLKDSLLTALVNDRASLTWPACGRAVLQIGTAESKDDFPRRVIHKQCLYQPFVELRR
jgi:hypothetical protein